ncbi:MAG: hypothetical protein PGN13_12205 [Patulibacter minatonensis]
MKLQAPSPSMGVAIAALIMASTGTAVAAATYASNAGKVDGRDAVSSKTSTSKAAGALVATAGSGPYKGKIPGKFLADVVRGDGDGFNRLADVQDNAGDVPTTLTTIPGFGNLVATCSDQNGKAGVEDPISAITFQNTSGAALNLVRDSNGDAPGVGVIDTNATSVQNIGGTAAFHWLIENAGNVVVIEGGVRQVGRNTAAAQCLVYGYAQVISNTR